MYFKGVKTKKTQCLPPLKNPKNATHKNTKKRRKYENN